MGNLIIFFNLAAKLVKISIPCKCLAENLATFNVVCGAPYSVAPFTPFAPFAPLGHFALVKTSSPSHEVRIRSIPTPYHLRTKSIPSPRMGVERGILNTEHCARTHVGVENTYSRKVVRKM